MLIPPFRKHIDPCPREDRIQQCVNAWKRQIPHLAEQYLRWKAPGCPCDDPSEMEIEASWSIEIISFSGVYNFSLTNLTCLTCLTWTIRLQQSRIPPHFPCLIPKRDPCP